MNPTLSDALQGVVRNDSPQSRQILYEAFNRSEVIVPVEDPQDGITAGHPEVPKEPNTSLHFMIASDGKGHVGLPVFTNVEALRTWQPTTPHYVVLLGADLLALALEKRLDAIVINPSSAEQVLLTRRELMILAENGTLIEDNQTNVARMVIAPDTYSRVKLLSRKSAEQLATRLRASMGQHPQVLAGYLAEVSWERGEPHPIVGIRFSPTADEHTIKSIIESLAEAVKPELANDEYLDFIVIDDNDSSRSIQASGILIFERSTA